MNATPTAAPSFIARLFSPRNLRRGLLLLAVVITVIGLFYTEENWRARRAWERFKSESRAQGLNPDWSALIPPPIPDEQNFFKAPNMQKWFTGRGESEFLTAMNYEELDESLLRRGVVPMVEVVIARTSEPAGAENADLVLQYKRPLLSPANGPSASDGKTPPDAKPGQVEISSAARQQMSDAIKAKVKADKPEGLSPKLSATNWRMIGPGQPPRVRPLRFVVRTDSEPTTSEIKEFMPADLQENSPDGIGVIFTGSNTLCVPLIDAGHYMSAADFLEWSDKFKGQFDELRAALERPYARMDGAYDDPNNIPIPNFRCLRKAAQMLARRAQCYLLLGEPDKALDELTVIHKLCRVLEGRPTNEPMTLIAAMINNAIWGLYVDIIGDGLEMRAWREPQLVVLQKQLAEADVLRYVNDAFQCEAISFGYIDETYMPARLLKAFYPDDKANFWARSYVRFGPRGWMMQNAVVHGTMKRKLLEVADRTSHTVSPRKMDALTAEIKRQADSRRPYNYMAWDLLPNYRLAEEKTAYNQTLVNEGLVACGLERYRLANGRYPETLDALVPKFVETLPHDLIGGEALKYRSEGGSFVLYSIGWNEADDGGVTDAKREVTGDLTKKDWVWPFQEIDGK